MRHSTTHLRLGAVPVVVRRGGQPEIVEHGLSGYLWDDIAQLATYSAELARDTAKWSAMSDAATKRARTFDGAQFVERFRAETARVGGLGIPLVAKLSADLRYERPVMPAGASGFAARNRLFVAISK